MRQRGPLGALRCPDATASDPDELVAMVRTASGDTEVARRAASPQGLLATPLDLDLADLRTAAGQATTDATDVTLLLVRASTACRPPPGGAPGVSPLPK